MENLRKDIFGYFDRPFDKKPAYDHGVENGLCLICCKPLTRPLKTISLMLWLDDKSYFYRTHNDCHDNLSGQEISDIEWSFIDSVKESKHKHLNEK